MSREQAEGNEVRLEIQEPFRESAIGRIESALPRTRSSRASRSVTREEQDHVAGMDHVTACVADLFRLVRASLAIVDVIGERQWTVRGLLRQTGSDCVFVRAQ